jgi:hypothetical protein
MNISVLLSILSIIPHFILVESSISSNVRGSFRASPKLSSPDEFELLEAVVLESAPFNEYNGTRQDRKLQLGSGLDSTNFITQVNKTHVFPAFTLDPDCASGNLMNVAVSTLNIEGVDKDGVAVFSNTLRWLFYDLDLNDNGMIISPRIVYDKTSERFIVAATVTDKVSFSTLVIAVSKDDNPVSGTSSDWDVHMIDTWAFENGIGNVWSSEIGLAVDESTVFLTGTMWHTVTIYDPDTFVLSKLWTLDKGGLYDVAINAAADSTQPLAMDSSSGIFRSERVLGKTTVSGGTDYFGPYYPATIENSGAKDSTDFGTYLVAYNTESDATSDDEELHIVRVSLALDDMGPTLTEYGVNLGDVDDREGPLPAVDQPGTVTEDYSGIETGARKIQDVAWFSESLHCALTVTDVEGETAVYYVELLAPSTSTQPMSLTKLSEYTMNGESIGSNVSAFYPSIAVNTDGEVVVGFGASGPLLHAGMYTQQPGNNVAQAVKTGESDVECIDGLAYFGATSGISVDPVEDGCYWVFNQYAPEDSLPEELHQWARGTLATMWAKVCLV